MTDAVRMSKMHSLAKECHAVGKVGKELDSVMHSFFIKSQCKNQCNFSEITRVLSRSRRAFSSESMMYSRSKLHSHCRGRKFETCIAHHTYFSLGVQAKIQQKPGWLVRLFAWRVWHASQNLHSRRCTAFLQASLCEMPSFTRIKKIVADASTEIASSCVVISLYSR